MCRGRVSCMLHALRMLNRLVGPRGSALHAMVITIMTLIFRRLCVRVSVWTVLESFAALAGAALRLTSQHQTQGVCACTYVVRDVVECGRR